MPPEGERNRLVTPRSSMAGVISSHCARHVRWVQGMRSLWPFWSFWSPAVTAVTYYDHEQAGCEDPVTSRLPDPGFPGRDHLAVGAHRRRGGRLAGEPGARPAVGAALACDRRVGRQQCLDPAGAARRRPGGGDPADGRDHPPLDQRQLRGRDRRPGHPLLASERGLDRQAGRRGSRPGAGGSDVGRRAARHARGLRQGKAPIFDKGQVIGMVSVGFLEPPLAERLLGELPGFATSLLPSLAIGVIASWVLAWRLKRQTFGLEPYEIAGLLEEREASLQGIHEGAIATDSDGTITLANDEARRLLMLPDNCVGRKVAQVLPQGRLLKFLSGGLKDEDEVLLAGERVLVASRRAIVVRGQTIGHVATLRDTTELTGLARGLGVDSLTDALRAQAHEFANRLHTIAGLMQLGRPEEAMRLIAQTSGVHQELTESLLERIGDPVLGALLLAKAAVASERGVELRVSDDTVLTEKVLEGGDLITLVGNLIDNALDAAAGSTGERWVAVSVTEQD